MNQDTGTPHSLRNQDEGNTCWRLVKFVSSGETVRGEKRGKGGISTALVHRKIMFEAKEAWFREGCPANELPSGGHGVGMDMSCLRIW